MKKTNKEQIELTLKLFAETLSRQFAISDDDEPKRDSRFKRI